MDSTEEEKPSGNSTVSCKHENIKFYEDDGFRCIRCFLEFVPMDVTNPVQETAADDTLNKSP